MAVELENEVVVGANGNDGSVSGRMPSVAGQFVKDLVFPNIKGDLKMGELKWGNKWGEGDIIMH